MIGELPVTIGKKREQSDDSLDIHAFAPLSSSSSSDGIIFPNREDSPKGLVSRYNATKKPS